MKDHQPNSILGLNSGKSLAKNTAWNLVGQGIPIIAAVFSIPLLIRGLGIDRFGVLTLAWMVIGYFSLFDFGIGRALTKVLAVNISGNKTDKNPAIVWSALFLMLLLGMIGAVVVSLLSPWLVTAVFKVPDALQYEMVNTFYLLASSIPIVISTAALRGVLEAYQRFDLANIIRTPLGLFMFIGPLLILPLTNNMIWIVAVLVAGRVFAWFFHLLFCIRVVEGLKAGMAVEFELLKQLLHFGSWMSISNLVGPLMVYLDRFLIGAFVSLAAVVYYTTPQEVVTKVLIIPAALTGVLFPAFASAFVQNKERTKIIFQSGTSYIFIALFPLILVIVTFAPEGLTAWLGSDFSHESSIALRCLAVGIFFNGIAQVPFALLQAAGRPDITAKIHVAELPFYIVTLYFLLSIFGINGAAVAWLLRAALDAAALFLTVNYLSLPQERFLLRLLLCVIGALLTFFLGWLMVGVFMKVAFVICTMMVFSVISWFYLLNEAEKYFLRKLVKISI